jgi:hypothetical protein
MFNDLYQKIVPSYEIKCEPLYRHWNSVQAVRPIGEVEV